MTTTTPTTNTKNASPVEKFQLGSIHVSIWQNTAEDGRVFYSTRIERRYEAEKGKWKATNSFSPEHLRIVSTLIDQASERIAELKNRR